MSHVRIYGDPFGEDAAANLLRTFLRLANGSGLQCSLALGAVRTRPPLAGETAIPLTDGVRDLEVGTRLPAAEIQLLMRAADTPVASTAPLVVFGAESVLDDAARLAGLEWPRACVVLAAAPSRAPVDVLDRVLGELRWGGNDAPAGAASEARIAPWLAIPSDGPRDTIVHPATDVDRGGTDLVLAAWAAGLARADRRLRIVWPEDAVDLGVAGERAAQLLQRARLSPGKVDIVRGRFGPEHCVDAAAILVPARAVPAAEELIQWLASGRPVCVSASPSAAPAIAVPGVASRIGGTRTGDRFEPDVDALIAAVEAAFGRGGAMVGDRGRRHVVENFVRGRPAPAPAVPRALGDTRPVVVLEAPFFETSSSAELTIETARALQQRGNVDLRLVPRGPFEHGLAAFRRRAPELESCLSRQPGRADLWLAAGWPPRVDRPDCRVFGLRVDWEYGALPVDLTPHVTQDADVVVVHSAHVRDCVAAAGRDPATIALVPHGVDEVMHQNVAPAADLVQWKGDRPAVLFCGGLVWRKGFDVFMRTVLAARAAGLDFVVVVKSVGRDRHYGQFHLGDLIERFRDTAGTPPLHVVDAPLARRELAGLYRACDVLLHPYRGEGFGLPVLEARVVGLPVITTSGGGADAMLEVPGAWPIPATRRELELPGSHVGTPWVLEPDPDAAARLLVETLRDLPARTATAQSNAAAVRERFRWSDAAAAIERLAGCLSAQGRECSEPIVPLVAASAPASAVGLPVSAGAPQPLPLPA